MFQCGLNPVGNLPLEIGRKQNNRINVVGLFLYGDEATVDQQW